MSTLGFSTALKAIEELRQKATVPEKFRPKIYEGSDDYHAQVWLNDAAETLQIDFDREDELRRYLAWEAIERLAQPTSNARQLSFAIWYYAEIHLPEPEASALLPMSIPSDWPEGREEANRLSEKLRSAASTWLRANPNSPHKPSELEYLEMHLWDAPNHENI